MGEVASAPKTSNPFNLKVGDKLLCVCYNSESEIEIVKVGRAWATTSLNRWGRPIRVSLDDLSAHELDRFYADFYLSHEHREQVLADKAAAQYLDKCWSALRSELHTYTRPPQLTLDGAQAIARALGVDLPPAPTKEPEA